MLHIELRNIQGGDPYSQEETSAISSQALGQKEKDSRAF